MKVGAISLMTAFLLMLPMAAFAGPDPCAGIGDTDTDGICDDVDNCVTKANPGQGDADTDGVGDVCDNCINIAQVSVGTPGFCDTDSDGYGNACDGDFDQGGTVGVNDFTVLFLPDFTLTGLDSGIGSDMDCGGTVGVNDFTAYFIPQFTVVGVPGPSGWSCAGSPPCLAP